MAPAAISGIIMRSRSPVSTRLAVHGAGVVAVVAKYVVGAGLAVRVGSAVRSQSAFACLESQTGAASGGQGRHVSAAAQRLGLEGLTPAWSHAPRQKKDVLLPPSPDFIDRGSDAM